MYQNHKQHFYRFISRLVLLLLLMWDSSAAQSVSQGAVTRYIGFPAIRNYPPSRYMAHGQNFGVTQDKRGMVYVANTSGILEHDGASWRTISTPNHAIVRSVACEPTSGRIYVGARGDFGYLMPDSTGLTTYVSLLRFLDKNEGDFLDVWRVFVAKDGVYFITNQAVFVWSNNKLYVLKSKEEIVSSFYVNGKLIIQYRDWELFTVENRQIVPFSHGEFGSKNFEIASILPYDGNKMIVATAGNGLYVYDGQTLIPFKSNAESYISTVRISEGTVLFGGTFAFGTIRDGIFIIDKNGNLLTLVNKISGLQSENVKYLFADMQGGLWLALNNGISRVEAPSPLTFLNENYGPNGGVTGIARCNDYIYFATYEGLYFLDEKTGKFSSTPGIISTCWSIFPTEKGLLVATTEGVYVIEKQAFRKITSQNIAFSLYRSRKNPSIVYVGEKNSVNILQLSANGWISSGAIPCKYNEIRELIEDDDGWVWIPTLSSGIVRFRTCISGADKPEISQFDTTSKLPSMLGNHVALLDGRAIFLTPNGVMKFDPQKNIFVQEISIDKSFRSEWLSKIIQDKNGNIWSTAGDDKKLTFYQKQSNNGIVIYKKQQTPFLSIATATVWSVFVDTNAVWIGGPEGVIRYDQTALKNYLFSYSTFIRKVTLNQDSVLFEGSYFDNNKIPNLIQNSEFIYVLAYDQNKLTFEFASATFDNPAENVYQYYLEGFDENWSELTKNLQKEYTNLSPGKYVFHTRAKNIHGKFGEEGIFKFEILHPWFKTWWAYSLYVLLGGGVIWLLFRWGL
ncbi:MAG: hypothetical protein HYZ42_01870 [Bacteroidetes bacterium]|nr:hypothetical protein [Bacteroidota bacterium]